MTNDTELPDNILTSPSTSREIAPEGWARMNRNPLRRTASNLYMNDNNKEDK